MKNLNFVFDERRMDHSKNPQHIKSQAITDSAKLTADINKIERKMTKIYKRKTIRKPNGKNKKKGNI